jgi:hypothetical protein
MGVPVLHSRLVELNEKAFIGGAFGDHFFFNLAPPGVSSIT